MAQSVFMSLILLILHSVILMLSGSYPAGEKSSIIHVDSIPDNQVLYNGRLWQNQYYMIKEHQFLFSSSFLPGTVTMRGTTFRDVDIRYDIFDDEIQIPFYSGGIIQLNKEMVDSFSIIFSGKEYRFVNMPADSSDGPGGYLNVLYHGKSELIVKHIKKIEKLSVEGKYDGFYEISKIYLRKDGSFFPIRNKGDAVGLAYDKKAARKFAAINRLVISKDDPESYIPLIRFMDKPGKQQ